MQEIKQDIVIEDIIKKLFKRKIMDENENIIDKQDHAIDIETAMERIIGSEDLKDIVIGILQLSHELSESDME